MAFVMNDYYAKDFIQQGHCYLFFKFNSPRRHEVHEEKPKKNLRVLRVFVVKCLKLMSMVRDAHPTTAKFWLNWLACETIIGDVSSSHKKNHL